MLGLANEELNSPLLLLKDLIDDQHKSKLEEAKAHLRKNVESMEKTHTARTPVLKFQKFQALKRLINSYLTFVNYLPMSTVKGGDPLWTWRGHAAPWRPQPL